MRTISYKDDKKHKVNFYGEVGISLGNYKENNVHVQFTL